VESARPAFSTTAASNLMAAERAAQSGARTPA
jgi:hypothetical protein